VPGAWISPVSTRWPSRCFHSVTVDTMKDVNVMTLARTPSPATSATARRLPRILALVSLVAAPLVAVFVAAPAGAGTPVSADFISGAASMKSGANTWLLSVNFVDVGAVGSLIGIGIQHLVNGNTGYELHSWSSDAKGASFSVNATTGKMTVNSGSSLSPVASFNVSFVPTKKTITACSGTAKETVYNGTLKGTVHLVTGTKPVSITLSSSSASFTSGTNMLIVNPCLTTSPCFGDSWSAPASASLPSGTVAASGAGIYSGTKLQNWATVTRQTELSKATSFTRLDGASAEAPTWSLVKKTLTVSGSSSGIVTGSGALTGATALGPIPETCTIAGKKYSAHETVYEAATLSKWKAFVAHTILTGTLTEAITAKSVGALVIITL